LPDKSKAFGGAQPAGSVLKDFAYLKDKTRKALKQNRRSRPAAGLLCLLAQTK